MNIFYANMRNIDLTYIILCCRPPALAKILCLKVQTLYVLGSKVKNYTFHMVKNFESSCNQLMDKDSEKVKGYPGVNGLRTV